MVWRLVVALAILSAAVAAQAAEPPNPAADLKAFQSYFKQAFPNIPADDFVNGPYAMDKGMRKQWEQILEFPPYDFAQIGRASWRERV